VGEDEIDRTRDGYYTGSDNAPDYIRWRMGATMYPAEKYAAGYHRPDLVAAALQGKP
jgi:hypothetical protein